MWWSMSSYARDPDDIHGDTIVASLEIKLRRNGAMSVGGSITDEKYALAMLESAKDSIRSYHRSRALGLRSQLIVQAHDTALVGTPEEKLLIGARDELSNAMAAT
jgi:hypothetical protein